MSHYEPKADPRWKGLGKVIVFAALLGGLLGASLMLLIGILAPSFLDSYWIGIPVGIGVGLAFVFAGKLWPAEMNRLSKLKRFRGW